MSKIYLLAGNASQAADWCRQSKTPMSSVRYVSSADHLRGLMDPTWIVVGTFWERHDAVSIWAALVHACTIKPVAPPEYEPFLHKKLPPLPIVSIPNTMAPFSILQPIVLEKEEPTPKKKTFKSIKP